jgi:hypothetical protein
VYTGAFILSVTTAGPQEEIASIPTARQIAKNSFFMFYILKR